MTIIVDDEDDNAPIFSANAYEGRIPENSELGTEVIMTNHISARDPDENANITFSLKGEGSHLFRIDQLTGRLFFNANSSDLLDREAKPLYSLRIVAGEGSKCRAKKQYLTRRLSSFSLAIRDDQIQSITRARFYLKNVHRKTATDYVVDNQAP